MVAEQRQHSGLLHFATSFCPVSPVTTTRPTSNRITPSSGEAREKPQWSSKLQEDQEFIPIIQAITGHKDVEGVLSEIIEQIKERNLDLKAITSVTRVEDDQDAVIAKIKDESKL